MFIVLIIFGAGKLPEIGAGLGKGIGNFKKASQESKELDVTPKEKQEADAKSDSDSTSA